MNERVKSQVKALLIFDSPFFSIRSLRNTYSRVDIFPLTGNWRDIDRVICSLRNKKLEVSVINSAEILHREAARVRDSFIEWTSAIGRIKVGEKDLRQWLLLSDKGVSVWWFGLLADKDPSKSPLFLKIVKCSAILGQIKECNSNIAILALKDSNFQRQLEVILHNQGIQCRVIKPRFSLEKFSQIVKDFFRKQQVFRILYTLKIILSKIKYLKKIMPTFKNRKKHFNDALLFFTYFPSLVKTEAAHGKFRNKFSVPLQDICKTYHKDIVWILFYADLDGYSFGNAANLARRFVENGEHLFFWQEFLSVKNILKASWKHLQIMFRWSYVRNKLTHRLFNEITGQDFYTAFFLEALDESIQGGHYLNGILQYEAFKNIFQTLSGFSHGLYTCEMMGWEYALVAAKRIQRKDFPVIAYQDFAFSNYLLQMFHSKEELRYTSDPEGIPFPDIIASCGRIPQLLLGKFYDKILNLETLRFAYVNELLQRDNKMSERKKSRQFILLVCTTIDLEESKSLVTLVDMICAELKNDFVIWFKGHPCLPVEKIFKEAGVVFNNRLYAIKDGSTCEYLSQSNSVFTGSSSVAVEALAFGCDVLIYLSAEKLNTSLSDNFNEFYYKVYDPSSLLMAIDEIRSREKSLDIEKRHKVIKEYWNLNPSLEEWRKVLHLSRSKNDKE